MLGGTRMIWEADLLTHTLLPLRWRSQPGQDEGFQRYVVAEEVPQGTLLSTVEVRTRIWIALGCMSLLSLHDIVFEWSFCIPAHQHTLTTRVSTANDAS